MKNRKKLGALALGFAIVLGGVSFAQFAKADDDILQIPTIWQIIPPIILKIPLENGKIIIFQHVDPDPKFDYITLIKAKIIQDARLELQSIEAEISLNPEKWQEFMTRKGLLFYDIESAMEYLINLGWRPCN